MTIILGINFGAYVLLAADTQATLLTLSKRPWRLVDNYEKINKIDNVGVVAGRGNAELLERVNSKLDQIDKVMSTDEVRQMIYNERQNFSELHPDKKQKIQNTAWLFSYFTFEEGTFDQGTPILRLSAIGRGLDIIGRRHLVDNYPCVIAPPEATKQDEAEITNRLIKVIKPFDQFETLSESVVYHWEHIAKLIKSIEPKFSGINSSCQIGVCTLDRFAGKSTILKDATSSASITLKPPPSSVTSIQGQSTTLTNLDLGFKITYPKKLEIEERHLDLGFKITYPKKLEIEERHLDSDPVGLRIFLSERSNSDEVSISIYVLESDTSLPDFLKIYLNKILDFGSINILSEGYSSTADSTSYIQVFQDKTFKTKQIYIVRNDLLYIITYKTTIKKYDKCLQLAQEIMDSFAFLKGMVKVNPNKKWQIRY